MAGVNAYTSSLRSERPVEASIEPGVPFFVPQLAKVKTRAMCQGKNETLLFCYETPSNSSASPPSPATLPYRKQGNRSLYTEENLLKRQRLMEDKQVLAAITRFWETFPAIRRGQETISEHDYTDVFIKFYKALVAPSEFSIPEAKRIVEKDWARDSIDTETMSKTLFFGALFEVADIWTIGIGADIYVSFLNKLFERVTMVIYDRVQRKWVTVFAELDRIRSFEDPSLSATDPNNQNLDLTGRTAPLDPIAEVPRPPLLKKKTFASTGVPPSSNAAALEPKDKRLPGLNHTSDTGRSKSSRRNFLTTRSDAESSDSAQGSQADEALMTPRSEAADEHHESDARARRHTLQSISQERSLRSPPKTKLELALEAKRAQKIAEDAAHKDALKPHLPRHTLPELPPQQIHLPMPNIYLDPDLSHVQEAQRAARRRLRNSAKLAQRLRRITF